MVSPPLLRGALLALVLALPALVPTGTAQLPPTPLDPLLDMVDENRTRVRETALGREFLREDVDVALDMEFRDVDFDTVNVIFGGGRFSADARVTARVDMRVLSAERVQRAVAGAVPGGENLTALGLADAKFIPADVFRATFTDQALAAFKEDQERRLAQFIRDSIPNVTVLSASFSWANASAEDAFERGGLPPIPPGSAEEVNDPRLPPITLVATVDLEYLERTSLLEILEKALRPKTEAEKERRKAVADEAASYERSAFGVLGIRQVLDLRAFSGWNVHVRVLLPQGYTFEDASPDVTVAPHLREAQVMTLAKDAQGPVLNPVALTLSNRFLVSVALLSAVLLCGAILRFPVLLGVNYWRRKMRE